MTGTTIRNFAAALLIGAAGIATSAFVVAQPAAAAAIKTPAVAKPLQAAQDLAKKKDWKNALAKAKEAQAAAKGSELTAVNQYVAYLATQARDYSTALATYDQMIASGEVNKITGLRTAMALALQSGRTSQALHYANELGGNLTDKDRILIAQVYYKQKNYKEVVNLAKPMTEHGGRPPEDALELLASSYYALQNDSGSQRVQELLVAYYPNQQHWHDYIRMLGRQRGLTDQDSLELYRLRLATGDLKTQDDYSEMAQIAIELGLPKEAQTTLDKAKAANVLSGERSQRLVNMTNDLVGKEGTTIAQLQSQANANTSDGNANIKLAQVLWTYGKYPEAEAAARKGIMEGNLQDSTAAKFVLGHILLSAGKKQEAAKTFASVPKTSKGQPIANAWAMYARG